MARLLEVEQCRGVTWARIVLEKIDSEMMEPLSKELHALVQKNTILLLDLAQVNYLFSEVLELILRLNKKLKKTKGKLALCSPQPTVREILFTTRFDKIMPIFSDENEAFQALST
jgi:anti-anti-sigma factor